MRSLLLYIGFAFLLFANSARAEPEWISARSTPGLTYYRPLEFYSKFKPQTPAFQEMKWLTPDALPELGDLLNFLERNGIPLVIGSNSNLQSIFELYLPMISRGDGQPGAIVSVTPEAEVGNLYFFFHDAVHHFVGIPGPRKADLKNKEEAKRKLVQIMMLKEQTATTHSMLEFIREYWNWREVVKNGKDPETIRRLNQGIFSMGPIEREAYVDLIGDMVQGRSLSYAKTLFRHLSPSFTMLARRSGVPLAIPHMDKFLGRYGEAYLNKFLFPIVEPISAYFREVGYRGFKHYSEATADFLYQDWVVEWADRFQYGVPLAELEQRAHDAIRRLRDGMPLGDPIPPNPLEFEHRFLENEIALFGRRIAEVRQIEQKPIDSKELEKTYEDAGLLSDKVRARPQLTADELRDFQSELDDLISKTEQRFPVDRVIPEYLRLPFFDYQNYWRDPTVVLVPRYGHNQSGVSPAVIQSMVQEKRALQSSRLRERLPARIRSTYRKIMNVLLPGAYDFQNFREELAEAYENAQQNAPTLKFEDPYDFHTKLTQYAKLLKFQIESVVKPQIADTLGLSSKERMLILEDLNSFYVSATTKIWELRWYYTASFLSKSAQRIRSSEYRKRERNCYLKIDAGLRLISEYLNEIKKDPNSPKVKEIRTEFEIEVCSWSPWKDPKESASDTLRFFLPIKKHRMALLLSNLRHFSRWTSRKNFQEILESISPHRVFRSDQRELNLRFESAAAKNIPTGEGIFVLAMNHDQGLADGVIGSRLLKDTFKVDEVYILTTKGPIFQFRDPDKIATSLVFIEDENPLRKLQEKIRASHARRIGVLIFPEGSLPYFYSQAPLAVKPGAFVLARRLATDSEVQSPVYFVQGFVNGLEHLTEKNSVPLEVKLSAAEKVPNTAMSQSDEWVSARRLSFEKMANQDRGRKMVDLIDRSQAAGTTLPARSLPREYLKLSDWYRGSPALACKRNLQFVGTKTEGNGIETHRKI